MTINLQLASSADLDDCEDLSSARMKRQLQQASPGQAGQGHFGEFQGEFVGLEDQQLAQAQAGGQLQQFQVYGQGYAKNQEQLPAALGPGQVNFVLDQSMYVQPIFNGNLAYSPTTDSSPLQAAYPNFNSIHATPNIGGNVGYFATPQSEISPKRSSTRQKQFVRSDSQLDMINMMDRHNTDNHADNTATFATPTYVTNNVSQPVIHTTPHNMLEKTVQEFPQSATAQIPQSAIQEFPQSSSAQINANHGYTTDNAAGFSTFSATPVYTNSLNNTVSRTSMNAPLNTAHSDSHLNTLANNFYQNIGGSPHQIQQFSPTTPNYRASQISTRNNSIFGPQLGLGLSLERSPSPQRVHRQARQAPDFKPSDTPQISGTFHVAPRNDIKTSNSPLNTFQRDLKIQFSDSPTTIEMNSSQVSPRMNVDDLSEESGPMSVEDLLNANPFQDLKPFDEFVNTFENTYETGNYENSVTYENGDFKDILTELSTILAMDAVDETPKSTLKKKKSSSGLGTKVSKKVLKKASSFSGNLNVNSRQNATTASTPKKLKTPTILSFTECSQEFSATNYSFVYESGNDESQAQSTFGDYSNLKKSKSYVNLKNERTPSEFAPLKILKNMKSGMMEFQVKLSKKR